MTNTTDTNAIGILFAKWRDAYNASADAYAAVLTARREFGRDAPEYLAAMLAYYPLDAEAARLYKELKAADAAAAKE